MIKSLNPIFNEYIDILIPSIKEEELKESKIIVKVFDKDIMTSDDLNGYIEIEDLLSVFYE